MPFPMSDDRLIAAMSRIERALSRLESLQPPPAPTLGLGEEQVPAAVHRRLHERNAQLRRQVENAVRRIDRLLAADEAA